MGFQETRKIKTIGERKCRLVELSSVFESTASDDTSPKELKY